MITVDLPKLITRQFDPAIRSMLGSMLVEIIEQFDREERLHGVDPQDFDGKAMAMIESIKSEIAAKFIGYHDDFMVRLKNVASLHLVSQTAIARRGKDERK